MKHVKFYILGLLVIFGTLAYGQKREIRKGTKYLENKDYNKAKEQLSQVNENDVEGLNKRYKGEYYLLKGGVALQDKDFDTAISSLKKASDLGQEEEAQKGISEVRQNLVQEALDNQKNQNFEEAYKGFSKVYKLFPEDTIINMAAGINAMNAGLDDEAIAIFEKLRAEKFDGSEVQYYADEKKSGKEVMFNSKNERELMMKSGQYENPHEKKTPSHRADVVKDLSLLYLRNKQQDKALEAIDEAIKANPDDLQMIKAKAQIYQETGQDDKLKKMATELIEKDPDNADVYYDVMGDMATKAKDFDEAEKLYKKAIEANEENAGSYNGLANVYLSKQQSLIGEMNKLGVSDEDDKKYEELDKKRHKLLEKALPYLEKSLKYNPDDTHTINTLYQLNMQLGNKEEAQKYKDMLGE